MAEKFQIVPPDRQKHGEQIFDLVCKTFGNYAEGKPHVGEWILDDPFYSLAATRIGIIGEQVVTHFGVYDYPMCVGTARLRTGGMLCASRIVTP